MSEPASSEGIPLIDPHACPGGLYAFAEAVCQVISPMIFVVASEAELQGGVARVLDAHYPGTFRREERLTERDRPDFWSPAFAIAIEVKLKPSGGSPTKVTSQLQRYAQSGAKVIILATPSRRVLSAMPAYVQGPNRPVPILPLLLNTGM